MNKLILAITIIGLSNVYTKSIAQCNIIADIGYPDTICLSSKPLILGGNPTAGGTYAGPHTYLWSWSYSANDQNNIPMNSLFSDINAANPTLSGVIDTITITLSIFDSLGCSANDQLIVNYNFRSPIANAGPDKIICIDDSAHLGNGPDSTIYNGTPPFVWHWTNTNNGTFLTPTTSYVTGSNQYSVTSTLEVTDSEGCFDKDQVTITYDTTCFIGPSSIKEEHEADNFFIQNPANQALSLSIDPIYLGKQAQLYSITGQQLFSFLLTETQQNVKLPSYIPAGVYILTVNIKENTISRKITVTR